MEIRKIDGRIDEVIASGASVHMEDMGENGWYLRIDEGERWWIFFQYEGEWSLFESSDDAPRIESGPGTPPGLFNGCVACAGCAGLFFRKKVSACSVSKKRHTSLFKSIFALYTLHRLHRIEKQRPVSTFDSQAIDLDLSSFRHSEHGY